MNGLFQNDNCCRVDPCCDNNYRNGCDNDNWLTIIIIIAVILLFCFNN